MPQVLAAVIVQQLATAAITKVILSAVISYALGQVVSALSPKPATPDAAQGIGSISAGRTQTIRNSIVSRRRIIGTAVVGPAMTYYAATDNNRYHHMMLTLADGVVDFGTFWIGDEPYNMEDLDGDGFVTTGRFANLVRLKFHSGEDDQVADSDFVSEVGAVDDRVDSNFRARGIAYVYARVDWDRTAMPNGLPAWRFTVSQKEYDPRSASTVVSDNAALAWRGYTVDTRNGLGAHGAAATDIAATEFTAAANLCDEIADTNDCDTAVSAVDVAGDSLELEGDRCAYFTGDRVEIVTTGTSPAGLSTGTDYFAIVVNRAKGGEGASPVRVKLATSLVNARAGTAVTITDAGTGDHTLRKTGEPRYRASGMVESRTEPQRAIDNILNSMNGAAVYPGGAWVLLPGAYRSPVLDLDESDLRGPLAVQTKRSRRIRCNTIKGKYASPFNDGEDAEYPTVTSSAAVTADGGEKVRTVYDQPATGSPTQAQRNAGQMLKRHRTGELQCEALFGLRALACQIGDTVRLSNTRRSWSNKTFVVRKWGLEPIDTGENEPQAMVVRLGLEATLSADYSWNPATEETDVLPSVRSTGSGVFDVAVPTLGTIASGTTHLFVKSDGTVVSRIYVPWTTITDYFVLQRGAVEVRYRQTGGGDSDWQVVRRDDPSISWLYLEPVEDGVSYDIQIRAINGLGPASDWSATTTHTAVGKEQDPSDVPWLIAQQSGVNVAFKWGRITDADRDGYDLRYGPRTAFNYDSATPVTEDRIARGTTITTALIPPGDWTFGIKAVDTSGNDSENPATVNLVVTNENDIVSSVEQAPSWLGTTSGFVRHWTGKLMIDSTELANARDNDDVFDNYVVAPVSSASYEAPAIDLGFDADGVRVWAEIDSVLGPGETAGVADPSLSIDYRDDAVAFDGFEDWVSGKADFRHMKAKITVDTSKGLPVVTGFSPVCDVQERTETGTVTVAIGGTVVTFAQRFHSPPVVQVTADGADRVGFISGVTETGFTYEIYDQSGTDQGGQGGWTAIGP